METVFPRPRMQSTRKSPILGASNSLILTAFDGPNTMYSTA
ncbi:MULTISPECIES: hypothetical protein [Methanobacterium]|uniref:Uncharacterized protein n=1 Tax=Methanobacterium veterum TaxID=408577 RepID=A0A9E4ZZY0_9EURY|nr:MULTISPECIES: hypothetical protein [Methanobacterium]MCZ3372067.1 hypothetical protein [Methanobacterium veterum]